MKLGIAGRLAVLLAAFAILVGGITGYSVYRISRGLLSDAAQARLLTTTQVLGRRVMGVMEGAASDAQRLADSGAVRAILRNPDSPQAKTRIEDVAEQFSGQLRFNPEYYQIRLISASENGLERVRVDRDAGDRLQRIAENDLQEKGHYPYVFQTLKLPRHGLYVSPMSINHEMGAHAGSEVPTLRIGVPVYDDDPAATQPLGLVVINLSLSGIFSVLGEDLPKDFELYLTDRRGEFLMHPDPLQAFAFDRGQSARVQDQFPETEKLFEGEEKLLVTTVGSRDGEARPVAAAFVRVGKVGAGESRFFVIGLAQPLDDVLKSTRELTTTIIPIVLGFGWLAALLAGWLGRAMTRPLRQMADAVKRFPAERVATSFPVTRTDELGVLARGLVAMESDIAAKLAELDRQRGEMAHQARHDPLTGLPNRLLFTDRIDQALARSRRHDEPVAILFIDLDKFKEINDRYGHAAGDATLIAVAQRLHAATREMDTVARIGGDEFVIIMEGTADNEYLRAIGHKLLETISEPVSWNGVELRVGASIGIACFPRDGDNVDSLTSCADSGMYRSKAAGGAGVVLVGDDLLEQSPAATADTCLRAP